MVREWRDYGGAVTKTMMISARRPMSTKALGLNMATPISEIGLNAPQNRVGKSVGMLLDRGGHPGLTKLQH
jgi:hypothetical protein